jgi:hypothetical protein
MIKNKNLFDGSGRRREKMQRAVFFVVGKPILVSFKRWASTERQIFVRLKKMGLKIEPICCVLYFFSLKIKIFLTGHAEGERRCKEPCYFVVGKPILVSFKDGLRQRGKIFFVRLKRWA